MPQYYIIFKVIPPPDAGIISNIIPDDFKMTQVEPHYQTVAKKLKSGVFIVQNAFMDNEMTYDVLKNEAKKHEPPPVAEF